MSSLPKYGVDIENRMELRSNKRFDPGGRSGGRVPWRTCIAAEQRK
jgi:hypothetical protein